MTRFPYLYPSMHRVYTTAIFFILLTVVFNAAYSQTANSAIVAQKIQRVQQLIDAGHTDSAYTIAKKAEQLLLVTPDTLHLLQRDIQQQIAQIYVTKKQPKKALDAIQQAINSYLKENQIDQDDFARYLRNTYYNYINKFGIYDRGIAFYDALKAPIVQRFGMESKAACNLYYSQSFCSWRRYNTYQALKYLDTALVLSEAAYGKNHLFTSMVYNQYANCHLDLNQYHKAIDYLKKSRAMLFTLPEEHKIHRLIYTYNLGLNYANTQQYNKARQMFTDNLEYISDDSNYTLYHADCLQGLGQIEKELKNYATAYMYFRKAVDKYNQQNDRPSANVAAVYNKYAIAKYQQQQYDSAYVYFHKALQQRMSFTELYDPRISNYYTGMAEALLKQNKLDQAYIYADSSLTALEFQKAGSARFSRVNSLAQLIDALPVKADILYAMYKKSNNSKDLQKAYDIYALTMQACEHLIHGNQDIYAKNNHFENYRSLYQNLIRINIEMYDHTDENIYRAEAFHILQYAKANTLQEKVYNDQAIQYAGVAPALLQKEKNLRMDISQLMYKEYLLQKETKSSDSSLIHIQGQLSDKKQELENLLRTMEKEHSDYYQLKHSKSIATIEQIQNGLLGSDEAILEYFLGDSLLFCVLITKNVVLFDQQNIPSGFEHTVKKLHRIISTHTQQPDEATISLVYNTLLAKYLAQLPPNIRHLKILPDSYLGYIPFELLQPSVQSPMLLEQYNVSYAYTSNILFQQKAKIRAKHNKYLFAGFSPTYEDFHMTGSDSTEKTVTSLLVRSGNLHLPGAQAEVVEIAALLNGDVFSSSQASKSIFMQTADKYRILHLSMHAIAEEDNPLYSKLLFTPVSSDNYDGYLHAAELYNMRLNADLAVLSACNTGLGKLKKKRRLD